MTVCVAAACDSGRKVVTATDGRLTYAGVTADSMFGKMYWTGDWLFLYAGTPATTKMVLEDVYELHKSSGDLTRENIKHWVLEAFRKRRAHLASFAVLSPYDLTMDEFRSRGKEIFTPEEFNRLSTEISSADQTFAEQLLVVGWGKAEAATMLYQVDYLGEKDHALTGVAAIGSGSEVALSTMLLLGQSQHRELAETIYAVAAAKFASEASENDAVGSSTAMYITWKRKSDDDPDRPPGAWIQPREVQKLRDVWLQHGRPKIPDEAWDVLPSITQSVGLPCTVSPMHVQECFRRSVSRKSKDQP